METEEVIELGFIAVIVIGIGFILWKAIDFFSESGLTGGASNLVGALSQPVAHASDTLLGSDVNVAGSDSNLFYNGIDNFFHTGSIYDTNRSN